MLTESDSTISDLVVEIVTNSLMSFILVSGSTDLLPGWDYFSTYFKKITDVDVHHRAFSELDTPEPPAELKDKRTEF